MNEEELLSGAAAAKELKIALSTLHHWVKVSRILPAIHVGGTLLIKRSDLLKADQISRANPERKLALAKKHNA